MGAVQEITCGHWLLAACALLYLLWWTTFFRPGSHVHGTVRTLAIASLTLAAICGITGLAMIARALPSLNRHGTISLWGFICAGVAAYAVLLALSAGIIHRPATTELALIVLWGTFEICAITVLKHTGLSPTTATPLLAVTAVMLVISLTCYMMYYRLGAWAAFIAGCIPLAAVGIEACAIAIAVQSVR